MRTAAGGPIRTEWCFIEFSRRLAALPPFERETDALHPDLVLFEDQHLVVRYCPFDFVNSSARVVIVGITPGLHQMFLSCREAQQAMRDGLRGEAVLRRVCDAASFAGSMRTNLVSMLNGIGLQEALGIKTTCELFEQRSDLLHSTSALLYPVFVDRKNYSGSPPALASPLLKAFIEQVFAAELAMVPDALVIPLGRTVERAMDHLVEAGALDAARCVFGFPHPSGANGHRPTQFAANRAALAAAVANWYRPH